MADLVVELYGTQVGTLGGSGNTFDFAASPAGVARFGLDSRVLSVAVPLAAVPTRAQRRKRANFFQELLPEGRMLDRLALEARVAIHDTAGLLRQYGRDVAGALQIWDPEIPGEPKEPRLEPLTEGAVAELLENVQAFPLGNKPRGGKSSLAGVQDKIVLVKEGNNWSRALDGYPSTHILKPSPQVLPTVIYDEEYGSRFVRALGLASYETWLQTFDGVPALVIERYDRSADAPQGRIHQEDFNQALGASRDEKYQRFGGKVSLLRIANLVSQHAGRDSLVALLRMVILSVAIGNLDMHAKNISLLHRQDGAVELAPAYDFVPQVHQKNDGELALAINGEYMHNRITSEHLADEAEAWGMNNPQQLIGQTLETILSTAESETPTIGAYVTLQEDVTRFTRNLMEGRSAGAKQ